MQKLLFLDFDGVLHSTNAPPSLLFEKVGALSKIILGSPSPCRIVISSSWRFHHELSALQEKFPKAMQKLIIGKTGEPFMGKWPRYNEIREYLSPDKLLTNWRALDDAIFEFPEDCEQLIYCHPKAGITLKELHQLEGWLAS